MAEAAAPEGLYCSTAGTYFDSKDELTEHYKSDFHRHASITSMHRNAVLHVPRARALTLPPAPCPRPAGTT